MNIDIQAMWYCDMAHSEDELRKAVAQMVVDCPTCQVAWTLSVCGGHATAAAFLKSIGGEFTCPAFCGTDVLADRMTLEDL